MALDFEYTDEQKEIRDDARRFADDHVEALAEFRQNYEFPHEIYQKGARFGPAQLIPQEYGGEGNGIVEFCLVSEPIGLYQEGFLTTIPLVELGTDEQMERYLSDLAAGEYPASPAITEPGGGSTFKHMQTTAEREGDEWIINGEKTHIHFGPEAGVMSLYAETEEGLTTFLIEGDNPGIEVVEKMQPIGDRVSPMYHFELNDARIPEDRVLGDVGGGFDVFLATFNFSRIGQASRQLGLGQLCLDRALEYASQREVEPGKYVTDFQGNKWTIADIQTKLRAARRLRDEAAWAVENDDPDVPLLASMAKLAAIHFSLPAIHESLQMMGGKGHYYKPFEPFMDYLGEYFIFRVGGGHRDVLRDYIADELLEPYEAQRGDEGEA